MNKETSDDVKIKVIDTNKLIDAINEGSYDINLSAIMALGAALLDAKKQEKSKSLSSAQPESTRKFVELVVEYLDPEVCPYKEYKGKPYYSIKYIENGETYVGYSTYNPKVLSQFLKEYFISSAQPNLQPTCNNLATDTISRHAAIEAVTSLCDDCDSDYCGSCRVNYPGDKNCRKVLEDLPSVTPKPEPCEDVVSRRKAFEYFVSLWECIGTIMDREEWEDVCKTTANELPSVTPKRKTGKWIYPHETTKLVSMCSECGAHGRGNFCSNCGADMGGELDNG